MPETPEIAVFVLLALPGFLALGLYTSLTPTRQHETANQIVLVIVLSILSYLVVAAAHAAWCAVPNPMALLAATEGPSTGGDGAGAAAKRGLAAVFTPDVLLAVGAASLAAALLGLSLAFVSCNEWLHRFARRTGLSRKFGYSSHWDVVVHTVARKRWISVIFEDGAEYIGGLESYSDASDERSLLLGGVAKYDGEGKRVVWPKDDFLFIPDVSRVRSMRLVAVSKEKSDGKRRKSKGSGR